MTGLDTIPRPHILIEGSFLASNKVTPTVPPVYTAIAELLASRMHDFNQVMTVQEEGDQYTVTRTMFRMA